MRGWESVMYEPLNGCILFIFERQFRLSSLLMTCAFIALLFAFQKSFVPIWIINHPVWFAHWEQMGNYILVKMSWGTGSVGELLLKEHSANFVNIWVCLIYFMTFPNSRVFSPTALWWREKILPCLKVKKITNLVILLIAFRQMVSDLST